jgi:hypothetical protein
LYPYPLAWKVGESELPIKSNDEMLDEIRQKLSKTLPLNKFRDDEILWGRKALLSLAIDQMVNNLPNKG